MGIFSDDRANELRNIFFDSSQEILQALNEDALLLEKSPRDPEIVRNLRRSVHTLKGDSAACGYKELSELAHTVEDVLTPEVAARDGGALVELMLLAADLFDSLLSAYRNALQPPSTEPLLVLIESIRNPRAEAAFAPQFHWSDSERAVMLRNASRGQTVYSIAMAIDPACPMRSAAAQLIRNVLEEVGTVLFMHPEAESTEIPDIIEAAISTHHDQDWIERRTKIPTVVSRVFMEQQAATPSASTHASASAEEPAKSAPAAQAAAQQSTQAAMPQQTVENPLAAFDPTVFASQVSAEPNISELARPAAGPGMPKVPPPPRFSQRERDKQRAAQVVAVENVLRVETERVDTVLDLVGELIIAKSTMHDLLTEMSRMLGNSAMRVRTADALVMQSQILNKLQRAVMKIRMVPVEQMFRRLPRVIRDTAKQTGREVNVIIEGENTDLDKSILDALAEPMMHLLRNAVDHGIERPLERAAAGKPTEGTVRLNAFHQGNQVVIEVSDDGAGIDLQKVLQKAISRGIITVEQAARMTDSEALELIFQAGLSTSSEVTELSGRGVGMDVVKMVMDRLKGTVTVRSTLGMGTTFSLKVPLTLAIIKALLFRVCGRLYAVPLGNVLEIIRSQESDVHVVDGREALQVREEVIPLIRLSQMHRVIERKVKLFVIVISLGERKIGLIVDHLIGEQELVIKALDEQMVSSELVSGASILGDGRVVLILSLSDVVEKLGSALHGNLQTAGIGAGQ